MLEFFTYDGSLSSNMTIQGDGNVGIGTTTPKSLLNLYASSADTLLSFGNQDSNLAHWFMGIDDSDNDKFKIATTSTQLGVAEFTIDKSGNVGIGTTTPYSKLTIWGDGTSGASALEVVDSASSTLFTVLDNGNVGIGTAAPNEALTIGEGGSLRIGSNDAGTESDIYIGSNAVISAGNSMNFIIDNNNSNADTQHFAFLKNAVGTTGATELVRIQEDGNVGIGTTSPLTKLSIEGTAGQPVMNIASSTGASLLYVDENGNVGIGTTSPETKFTVVDGAILASGTTGATPTSGAGTRLMWIPAKSAFRAGYIDGTQWDDASIGNKSFAANQNTIASGPASFAIGQGAIASGNTAFAHGYYSEAPGTAAVAMGQLTVASGEFSFAMGRDAIASGDYSVAMGKEIEAQGNYSIAFALNDQNGTTITQANTMAIMGGNVGIGTTTPYSKLTVWGDGTSGVSALEVVDSASSTLFTVLDNGNVGIGTSTPFLPLTLHSASGQRDLGVFNGAICADNNGTTKCYAALTAGTVYGDTSAFGASDIAENYPVVDKTIEAGDVVVITEEISESQKKESEDEEIEYVQDMLKTVIAKSQKPHESRIIGVVSTQPGVLLGDITGMTMDTKVRPVALSGRVPVKINLEAGEIKVGDLLTSSAEPGVAMKSDKSGPTIGMALEPYNQSIADSEDDDNKILCFINLEQQSQGMELTVEHNESGQLINNATLEDFKLKLADLGLIINEYGILEVKEIKAKSIETENLKVKANDISQTGITMYDRATGKPYCFYIENGVSKTSEGECGFSLTPSPSSEAGSSSPAAAGEGEAEADIGAIVEECDLWHLDLCGTQESCGEIGLYWYDDQCNIEPPEAVEEESVEEAEGSEFENTVEEQPQEEAVEEESIKEEEGSEIDGYAGAGDEESAESKEPACNRIDIEPLRLFCQKATELLQKIPFYRNLAASMPPAAQYL